MVASAAQSDDSTAQDVIEAFDAGEFLSLLLSTEALVRRLDDIKSAGKKIVFIVPGKSREWMADAGQLERSLDSICFYDLGPRGEGTVVRTKQGLWGLVLEDKALLWPELLSPSEDPAAHDFDLVEGQRTYGILNAFSIDTEEIVAKVVIINSDHVIRSPISGPLPDLASAGPAPSIDSLADSPREGGGDPWREAFLGKLKATKADPVIREIKRIIRVLTSETLSTTEKSSATQAFYESMRCRLLRENELWVDASPEELDGSLDVVDKYIFGKCFSHVYQPADKDDALQDRLFVEKTQLLRDKVSLPLLTGDETIQVSADHAALQTAEDALRQISLVESPSGKLETLMMMVKGMAEKREGGETSADLLIPLLVWVVIKVEPATLISDVRYIQRFRDHGRLAGEAAYCLTNIIAVITTVEKMYAEQVSKTDPIYSMLASQESLPVNAAGEASLPYGTRPLAELNSMATTVINTIGFVPRAIGSAVVDTFRSRSSRAASKEPSLGSSPSTLVPPPAAKPSLAEIIESRQPEAERMRHRVTKGILFEELTLRELRIVVEDYRDILVKINKL